MTLILLKWVKPGMTRLYYDIIKDIPDSMENLDKSLAESTGLNLFELAARAAGTDSRRLSGEVGKYTAAVVPITSGKGIITGFSEAVSAILCHLGFAAHITGEPDVAGIGEVFNCGADIFFAADDRKFLAVNLKNSIIVDNSQATAAGFVHALAAAAEHKGKQLKGQPVLVIGLGPVGSHAVYELERLGARVRVFDTDTEKMNRFSSLHGSVTPVSSLAEALLETDYVLDAAPAPDIVTGEQLRPEMVVSCPGVPHGLTAEALADAGSRFIHDKLPLGVAVMALRSISNTWV